MATGGRYDHVRWTRSLSCRALGGDRDPGWLYRLRPRGAHSRDAGRSSRACCWRAPPSSSPSASGPCISSACWPRRFPPMPSTRAAHHHLVPDLRAGGRHLAVLRLDRRTLAQRVISSAVLLGPGIASMHYVGMHGLSGNFAIRHDVPMVLLSVLVGIVSAYGGLRAFLARQDGLRLVASSIAFGDCGVGHALYRHGRHACCAAVGGCACACRPVGCIAAAALDHRRRAVLRDRGGIFAVAGARAAAPAGGDDRSSRRAGRKSRCRGRCRSGADAVPPAIPSPRLMPAPLGGLGQPPRAAPAPRLPVEGADGTHFINAADIRSVRADAHYTRVHDGTRERMCPWSISEAEAQLDPGTVRPGASQPYRGDAACHFRPQGR